MDGYLQTGLKRETETRVRGDGTGSFLVSNKLLEMATRTESESNFTRRKSKRTKRKKSVWYGVHRGFIPGAYHKWEDAEQQIKGFSNAMYHQFATQKEAEIFVEYGPVGPPVKCQDNPHEKVTIMNRGSIVGIYFGSSDERNFTFISDIRTASYHSILGVLRALDCIESFNSKPIVIHVPTVQVYNILSNYIYKWKAMDWHKSNNSLVQEIPLLDTLQSVLTDNIQFAYKRLQNRPGWVRDAYDWFSTAEKHKE